MSERSITQNEVNRFTSYLRERERSESTVEKYVCILLQFATFLEDRTLCKREVQEWRENLILRRAPATVNADLAAINSFLTFAGREDCRVRRLKIQSSAFAEQSKELSEEEYRALVRTAERRRDHRLSLVLQTICATGIRVSELKYITVESAKEGYSTIRNKGKIRRILLPKELCRALQIYAKSQNRAAGAVFVSKNGRPLDRFFVWRAMKGLCAQAGVAAEKVFPHNLRHLFARVFYRMEKDLSRLADILGHSSIATTRIYTMESGTEHRRMLDGMHLVLSNCGKKKRATELQFCDTLF